MVTADFVDFFLEATEAAAVAASPWRGKGDGKAADGAAVEAMRAVFDKVPFDGRVAIGEGESCLLYTSPSPRDGIGSRMPSSA